ncbi:MAG: hypothetical protein ACK6CT_08185, partial [Planctomycetia bacterium]
MFAVDELHRPLRVAERRLGIAKRLGLDIEKHRRRLHLRGHVVGQVTLLLDDRLADLDSPVRVLAGDRELVSTPVPRTVTALVASLVE